MSTANLSPSQLAYAKTIISVVKARKLSTRAAVITLETAIVESAIQVFANAAVPGSMAIKHDAVGSDHLSVGIFQQQVPMWGSVADCMDPAKSAGKFLDRLVGFNWQSMSTGQAAQTVQGSAFPDRYQTQEAWAIQIVNALWTTLPPLQEDDMTPEQEAKLDKVIDLLRYISDERGSKVETSLPMLRQQHALIIEGDHGVLDAQNTHPNNLKMINETLKAIETKLGITP